MGRFALKVIILFSIPFFWGCAVTPQNNVNFSPAFWENKEQSIGVYVTELPEVKGHISGAGCLLCLATASAINSDLNTHMKEQSNADLSDIQTLLVASLNERGINAKPVAGPIDISKLAKYSSQEVNAARKDFTSLSEELNVDQLMVVSINTLGTMRNFANYVPVGDPFATFNAVMYVVDTKTNTYNFYEAINLAQYSETPWKEENFPGVTNAYYTALELGKTRILDLNVVAPSAPVAASEESVGEDS